VTCSHPNLYQMSLDSYPPIISHHCNDCGLSESDPAPWVRVVMCSNTNCRHFGISRAIRNRYVVGGLWEERTVRCVCGYMPIFDPAEDNPNPPTVGS
jgi:hypothetical protein